MPTLNLEYYRKQAKSLLHFAQTGDTAALERIALHRGNVDPAQVQLHDAQLAIASILQGQPVPDEKLFDALYAQGSLIVGSPQTCREKIKAYADLGIDRLMTFQQVGGLPHESVMRSIQLIGELIPEFDVA